MAPVDQHRHHSGMPQSSAPQPPESGSAAPDGTTAKTPGGPPNGPVPTTVRVAALVVAVMAIVFGCLGVVEVLSTAPRRPEVGITTGITFLGYAGLLLITVRGLFQRRSWARGAAVCAALLQLPIAVSFWGPGTWGITIVAVLSSLVVIVLLVTGSATTALARQLPADAPPDSPDR